MRAVTTDVESDALDADHVPEQAGNVEVGVLVEM
jgi:hypothetical protein